jgi:hypothetical protein
MMMQSSSGAFYVDAANETIVDPQLPPVHTQVLLSELRKCDGLVQRDLRYAHLVAGASKMPLSMVWTARNQDRPVSDTDLAALRDVAWTEFIKKRYLPGLAGTATVQSAAASMLEIVRDMNLQRRRFLIMGLHEQVEASEIQLVLHLCQAEIIRTDNYRATANRYRRHDKLFEAFALAVGAFVCASAPFTLGSGTGRYERDLQFEYKKQTTALFVWALRRVRDAPEDEAMEEDYVARIARLIVVRPDDAGGGQRAGFLSSSGDGHDSSDAAVVRAQLLDAVAEAQRNADAALVKAVRLESEGRRLEKDLDAVETRSKEAGRLLEERAKEMESSMERVKEGVRTELQLASREVENSLLRIKQEILADASQFTFSALRELNTSADKDGFFAALKNEIKREHEATLSRIQERLGGFERSVGELQRQTAAVTALTQHTDELRSRVDRSGVDSHESRLAAMEQYVGNVAGNPINLQGRFSTLEGEISNMLAQMAASTSASTLKDASTDAEVTAMKLRQASLEAQMLNIERAAVDRYSGIQAAIQASTDARISEFQVRTTQATQEQNAQMQQRDSRMQERCEQCAAEVAHMRQTLKAEQEQANRLRTAVEGIQADLVNLRDDMDENIPDAALMAGANVEAVQSQINAAVESKLDSHMIQPLVEAKVESILDRWLKSNPIPPNQAAAAGAPAADPGSVSMSAVQAYIDTKIDQTVMKRILDLEAALSTISLQGFQGGLDPGTLYRSNNAVDSASFDGDAPRMNQLVPHGGGGGVPPAWPTSGVRRGRSPEAAAGGPGAASEKAKRRRGRDMTGEDAHIENASSTEDDSDD